MQRRAYLALGGAALSALAGCSELTDGADTPTGTPDATPTPTETATATETESPPSSEAAAEHLAEADEVIEGILDEYAAVADADSIVDVPPNAERNVPWFDGERQQVRDLLDEADAEADLGDDQAATINRYRTEVRLIGSFVGIQRGLSVVYDDAQWLLDRIRANNRQQARHALGDVGDAIEDESLDSATGSAADRATENDVREEIEAKALELRAEVETYLAMDAALDPGLEEAWDLLDDAREEHDDRDWDDAVTAARETADQVGEILDDLEMDAAANVATQYDFVWDTFGDIEAEAEDIEQDASEEADD